MEPQSNQQQITQQLANQLMDLIDQNIDNAQVLNASLNTIVQYTKTQLAKLHFLNQRFFENIKLILNFPTYAPLYKICLTLLVHMSSEQKLANLIITKNIEDVIMKVRSGIFQKLLEELSMLLLLNVSKFDYFVEYTLGVKVEQQKIEEPINLQNPQLSLGNHMMLATPNQDEIPQQQKPELKPKQKPEQEMNYQSVILSMIYSLLDKKPNRAWIIANVFVNLSAFDHGRKYVAQEKLYTRFLEFIHDEKDALRLAVLRIVRNVAFLWEQEIHIKQILKEQYYLIDHLVIHILLMLYIGQQFTGIEPTEIIQALKTEYVKHLGEESAINNKLKSLKESTKNKDSSQIEKSSMNQVQICVDILVILSNSNWPQRKPVFSMEGLKSTISMLKFVKSKQFGESSRDKLEALETFCLW